MIFTYKMKKNVNYKVSSQILSKALPFIIQITLESKKDGSGNCYIHFYILANGITVVNQKSENKECKTYGRKNRLDFGPDWSDWQGWVRLGESLPAKQPLDSILSESSVSEIEPMKSPIFIWI